MLFSEPKIPQSLYSSATGARNVVSVLFSEPKIPQFNLNPTNECSETLFQCSSASRKFLNSPTQSTTAADRVVSVLFSEPKIPQFSALLLLTLDWKCFSALQRAENSSIVAKRFDWCFTFTCFSALQRAENSSIAPAVTPRGDQRSFSALQRAENSSMSPDRHQVQPRSSPSFSALQRAENSSIVEHCNIAT